jgi:hypothetical protein
VGQGAAGNAVQEQKLISRPDNEEREGVPIEPVEQPSWHRPRKILTDGERTDVADAAPGEVARGGVMHCMVAAPEGIGRGREDPDSAAEEVVRPSSLEIRPVPAIVLDDEEADQEGRGEQYQDQGGPDLMSQSEEDSGDQG